MSSASAWPRSATLTFAVRHPDPATILAACSGPTAGTVTFTGIRSLTGAASARVADSMALASHRALSFGPYSANGENSPHPAGPSISAPSRTVIPRNLTGMRNRERPQPPSIPARSPVTVPHFHDRGQLPPQKVARNCPR